MIEWRQAVHNVALNWSDIAMKQNSIRQDCWEKVSGTVFMFLGLAFGTERAFQAKFRDDLDSIRTTG